MSDMSEKVESIKVHHKRKMATEDIIFYIFSCHSLSTMDSYLMNFF